MSSRLSRDSLVVVVTQRLEWAESLCLQLAKKVRVAHVQNLLALKAHGDASALIVDATLAETLPRLPAVYVFCQKSAMVAHPCYVQYLTAEESQFDAVWAAMETTVARYACQCAADALADKCARCAREVQLIRERLNFIFQASSDVFWDWSDDEVHVLSGAEKLQHIWPEALPLNLENFRKNLYSKRDTETLNYWCSRALQDRELDTFDMELCVRTARGSKVWTRHKVRVLARDDSGVPVRIVGTITDITERKRREHKIINSNHVLEQQVKKRTRSLETTNKLLQKHIDHLKVVQAKAQAFQDTIDASSEAIIWLNPKENFKIIYANQSACAHFGYTKEMMYQFTLVDIIPQASMAERLSEEWNQRLLEKGVFETIHKHHDGSFIPVEITVTPFTHLQNICVAYFIRDISHHKEAEGQLLKNLEAERELRHMKDIFVNITSHEFRTPLAALRSALELLENYDDKMTQQQRCETFSDMKISIKHMATIMDDILLLGKANADQLKETVMPTDVGRVVKQCVKELQLVHKNRIIECVVEAMPEVVHIDGNLLMHILTNLLSNAIKYSNIDQSVTISVEYNNSELCVKVQDRGIGIPEEDRGRLFNIFYRGSNVENIKGVGVGLFLIKRCVDIMGGNITFDSVQGEGTIFQVRLPCKPEQTVEIKPASC